MKIAFVGHLTVRGIEQRLARFVAEVGGHETVALIDRCWHAGWPWEDVNDAATRNRVLDWADVLHFCGATSPRLFNRPELIDTKLCVAQTFTLLGERWWKYGPLWTDDERKRIREAVIAEGWDRDLYWRKHSFSLVPGVFPIYDTIYKPAGLEDRNRHICFSPKKVKEGPPSPKAMKRTVALLSDIPQDLVTHTPFEDCMRRKRLSWVGIDELLTPMVHFSGFEFLSLGVPCFQLWDAVTERAVLAVTGASRIPFLPATFGTIHDAARHALDESTEAWAARCVEARTWMERHMDPHACARQYLSLYEKG